MVSEHSFNTKRPNGHAKHSLQKINHGFETLLTNRKFLVIKNFTFQDSKNSSDHEHRRRQQPEGKTEYPHMGRRRTGG